MDPGPAEDGPSSAGGRRERAPAHGAEPLPYAALDLAPEEIQGRFRWALRRGHPSYLWPEVPVTAWKAGLREIGRVVRGILQANAGESRLALPAGCGVRELGVAAFTSGMGPLLGHWIEEGALCADPPVESLMRLHLLHGRDRAARLRGELLRVLDLLGHEGIPVLVIKGAHTSHAYFPEPGTRPAADIDLVIAPGKVARSERILRAAGFQRCTHQARPYKCDWIPPGAPRTLRSLELTHADNPYTVEIHASLERSFFGVRSIDLTAEGEGILEAWPDLHPAARTLSPVAGVAYLALHLSEELHHFQMVRLVELALAIAREGSGGRLDWDALFLLLERYRAMRFAYPAVALVERLVPALVRGEFRARIARSVPARMVRVVADLHPGDAPRLDRLSLAERFMWARGPAEVLRRAAYLVWPWRAGGSLRPLRRVYTERIYQLLRGTVSLRAGGTESPG